MALDGLGVGSAGTLAKTGLPKLASLFSERAIATATGGITQTASWTAAWPMILLK
ncbi:hypothetical protein LAG90_09235 [Marinilongibacter aquaticus]|uniref:hypothetical protein n=1 Tax=Marinilongibacter aquaticus TaxID=2975157 RepID=UPI0021BD1DBE|nr:hypothetical protein [Marinilongibacter aquaticus]UBM60818.1 hypothetical protein LAG90_09235 [Marinilongibacter aquaticus]